MQRLSFAYVSLWFALAALFCLFLSGCAARHDPLLALDLQDLPEGGSLYGEVIQRNGQVNSLSGSARIRLRVLDKKVNLDAVIVCDRTGLLRMEVLDFLDHVIFLVLLREDRLLVYSVQENSFFEVAAGSEQFRKTMGVPLSGRELISVLLGSPLFVPVSSPEVAVALDEGAIMLRAEKISDGLGYMIWLDAKRRPWRSILSREEGEEHDMVVVQADFERYQAVDTISFPFEIRVTDLASQEFFKMEYQSVILNQPVETDLFKFELPPDAEKVEW